MECKKRKLKTARSCVYTYKKRTISNIHNKKPKGGRPEKINERVMRKLLRTIKSLREWERNVHPTDLLGKGESILKCQCANGWKRNE